MFQPIIAGSEVGRGYSELNDPIDQKERFDAQKKLIESGDTEAMMSDDDQCRKMARAQLQPILTIGYGSRAPREVI